ncbi:inner-membrane translocator [Pyrolobus fumarii 1A]|uniref:Inner-membrane translocator n=1 Tax=Pyrolobus fumarii (strain DSM 11204 / 1A) TaxID=694429 RepID=G0EDX2_PYRF1|nr:ABC transporter permease [Pyrolobus fumarii]AEM38741.1 inner-membrane translocator [Pyrolobus fumarii 1A]
MLEAWLVAALAIGALNFMTPVLLATIGEIITEKSGVVNIGIEGVINLTAFIATVVAFYTGDPWVALTTAMIAGLGAGLAHGVIAAYLRGDQIVAGIGFNMIAYGVTVLGLVALWGQYGSSPSIPTLPSISIGRGLPLSPLAIIAVIIAVSTWYFLTKTDTGLRLQACGEEPRAAEAMGVNVLLVRTLATGLGGLLAGLGGGYLALTLGSFTRGIAAGRGFIALANVAFSGWNPLIAILGAYVFGFLEAVAITLQSIPALQEYSYLVNTLPYLGTLLVIAGFRWRARMPRALAKPYIKE